MTQNQPSIAYYEDFSCDHELNTALPYWYSFNFPNDISKNVHNGYCVNPNIDGLPWFMCPKKTVFLASTDINVFKNFNFGKQKNCCIEANVFVTSDNYTIYDVIGKINGNNYYMLELGNEKLSIWKYNGSYKLLRQVPFDVVPNTMYNLNLKFERSRITATCGSTTISVMDDDVASTSGTIGFRSNVNMYVRDVKVIEY